MLKKLIIMTEKELNKNILKMILTLFNNNISYLLLKYKKLS
jgi:hypothetical protein